MALTLAQVPGFADQNNTTLAHDKPALGLKLARINDNAAFGMVRLEVFTGTYANQDTVPVPTSPVDGYVYSRDELYYMWAPQSTGNPKNNWASAGPPWTMWYVAYLIDQDTGLVSCNTGYRGNNDHKDRQLNSNDGSLLVWTIAQRQRSRLSLAAIPTYTVHNDADFATDFPLKESLIQQMNESAKHGVVNAEVIYMGEFKNGDVVSTPVSPADGYAYSYAETRFVTCMRWTGDDDGTNFKSPDLGKGQLSDWAFSVDTVGNVTTVVRYELGSINSYSTGRVAVFAFCQRGFSLGTFTIPGDAKPWSVAGPPNSSSFPMSDGSGSSPVVVISGLTAGQLINVEYVSGGVRYQTGGSPPFTTDGIGNPNGIATGIGSTGNRFPAFYDSSSNLRLVGLIGAFVNNSGDVISVKAIGNGRTMTVPVGATKFQVGVNDDKFSDNSGSYVVQVTGSVSGDIANDFAEIPDTTFFPGNPLRASIMKQIAANIREAEATPEFFGPVNYNDGDTVPLPVSPVDAYAYTRDEISYVWDWADIGPDSLSTDRLNMAVGHVDSASGAVSIDMYRYASGGSNWHLEHTGSIRVLVFARRETSNPAVSAPTVTAQAGSVTDDSDGSITVDGV
jgi:hypothetical protein